MAFPVSPTNGQQATVNGVIYTYVSATGVWSVTTNSGANVSANNISSTATVTVGTSLAVLGSTSLTGNATVANVSALGAVSAVGNVTANYLLGNGSLLSGVVTSVSNINSGTSNVTVVSSGGNVTIGVGGSDNIALFSTSGLAVTGNITTSGQLTLTNASDYNLYASGAGDNFMQGALGVGALPAASTVTLVGSNPATGATTVNNILLNSDIQSDVTSTYNSYNSNPTTAATAFTLTNLRHFSAQQRTLGAGSTVTNQVGFYALSTLTGATNNYGFQSAIASGTGRFNFYASGTANNYFAGSVGIGTTTPGFPLTVSGEASVSGNITGGNLNTAGRVVATGNIVSSGNVSAGNLIAGANVIITNGVYYANGAPYSSGSGGGGADDAIVFALALG